MKKKPFLSLLLTCHFVFLLSASFSPLFECMYVTVYINKRCVLGFEIYKFTKHELVSTF